MPKSLVIVLGLAAGILGALLTAQVLKEPAPAVVPGAAPRADAGLEELHARLDTLAARVEMLERNPVLPPRPADVRGADPVPDPVPFTPVTPEALDAKVREVLAESREAERRVRGQFFSTRARTRETTLLDRLTADYGLTDYQREEMVKLFAKRREAIGQYHRLRFSPEAAGRERDVEELRVKSEDVRKDTDDTLKSLLSAGQYEVLKKEEERRSGTGRRGERGR